ncbi:MAG: fibronectin type III domain-containing protein [Candidatus Pacebacteria bacterium]|nr:fibronectin type III domain-containing protein [Candidatus Paceibacterota bacterium]
MISKINLQKLFALMLIVSFSILGNRNVFAGADTTPPTTPTQLIAIPVSSSQVNLSWMASTDDTGVAGYNVYENGNEITTTTNNSYYVSGLSASTTYSFTVSAYDAAGNTSGQSTSASATTTVLLPPTVPTLTINTISPSQYSLSWTASTSSIAIAGYDIFQNGVQIGTTTNTYYNINGLLASTTYYFTVDARDTLGNNSGQSTPVSVTTPGSTTLATTIPLSPASLQATPVSSSQIDLTWTAPTDSFGITGYDVYQAGAQIGTTANTYYTVTSLTPGTIYSFTVASYDATGDTSPQSTSAGAMTMPAPVVTPTTTPTTTPATTPTGTPTAPLPGCLGTNSFSVTTGLPCNSNTTTPTSTTTTSFQFTQLLKRGSSGNEVVELQTFLNNAGYSVGTADGKFGLKTQIALSKFQIANGLKGDGVAGAMTRAVLNK